MLTKNMIAVDHDNTKALKKALTMASANANQAKKEDSQQSSAPIALIDFAKGFDSLADFLTSYLPTPEDITPSLLIQAMGDINGMRIVKATNRHDMMYGAINIENVVRGLRDLGFTHTNMGNEGTVGGTFLLFNERFLPVAQCNVTADYDHTVGDVRFYTYFYTGPESLLQQIHALISENLKPGPEVYPTVTVANGIALGSFGHPSWKNTETVELKDDSDMFFALPEFYPWITISIADYFEEFFNSSANVLVLIGPAGTGKSTLLRTGLRDAKANGLVVYKNDVIVQPEFIPLCQQFLEVSMYDRNKNKGSGSHQKYGMEKYLLEEYGTKSISRRAVVIEDADLLMAKRSDGNYKMSEILNATDGIATKHGHKFIFSTNLDDIDSVDPALLRPGRCFDILQFGPLTSEQAKAVRTKMGLPNAGIEDGRRYKLAEILNAVNVEKRSEPIVKPRFGFI